MGDDGRPRGFAHVEFASNADAVKGMEKAGNEIDGRVVRLDLSVLRKPGGRGFGDRGGRGGGGAGRGPLRHRSTKTRIQHCSIPRH